MVIGQNPLAGLVKVILTLVVLGIIVGLLIAGTQSLNKVGDAKAERMLIENEQLRNQIEQNRQFAQAETEAKIQMLRNRTALLMAAGWAMLGLAIFLAMTIIICAAVVLVTAARRKLKARVAAVKPASEWADPRYRAKQIAEARLREQQLLQAKNDGQYKVLRIQPRATKSQLN